jgi:methionyl aminopeptidase
VRKAGRLVAECFDMLAPEIMSGLTTEHINRLVFEFAMDYGLCPRR